MPKLEWCEKTAVITLPSIVTLETLPSLLKSSENILSWPVRRVDFSLVQQADSAMLALLLIWSKNSPPPIKVCALPNKLQSLMALYDLETIVFVE